MAPGKPIVDQGGHDHEHFRLDRAGILVSIICLVHCLLPAILLLAFPFITALQTYDLMIHIVLALVMIPLAVSAIFQGYKHHRRWLVPTLASFGLALFLVSLGMLSASHHTGHWHINSKHFDLWSLELMLSVVGSLALTFAHALNIYFCRGNKGLTKS